MKKSSYQDAAKVLRLWLTVFLLGAGFQVQAHDVPGDTVVYTGGSTKVKRVHREGCPRLTKDPAELAKMTKMTLGEARAKGIPLCSRCPGSTTPGKGNAEGGNKSRGTSRGEKARAARLKIPETKYDPDTTVYCDALWMHEKS